jgi:hypothetical protein
MDIDFVGAAQRALVSAIAAASLRMNAAHSGDGARRRKRRRRFRIALCVLHNWRMSGLTVNEDDNDNGDDGDFDSNSDGGDGIGDGDGESSGDGGASVSSDSNASHGRQPRFDCNDDDGDGDASSAGMMESSLHASEGTDIASDGGTALSSSMAFVVGSSARASRIAFASVAVDSASRPNSSTAVTIFSALRSKSAHSQCCVNVNIESTAVAAGVVGVVGVDDDGVDDAADSQVSTASAVVFGSGDVDMIVGRRGT